MSYYAMIFSKKKLLQMHFSSCPEHLISAQAGLNKTWNS